MESGDHITIYKDPVTKTQLEGMATLVERLPSNPHHVGYVEVWYVRMDTGETKACYISK
jgi:hypothetical protein